MPDGPPSDSSYELAPRTQPTAPDPLAPPAAPTAAQPPLAPPAAPTPSSTDRETERNCPHCGFRIVGKPRRNRCPDCAAPLDEVAADLLQFADRPWIVRLSNGALLLAAAIVLHVLAAVCVAAELHVGSLLHAIAGIALAVGIWMAATPEPAPPVASSAPRSPFAPAARIATIAAAVLWTLALIPRLDASRWSTLLVLAATAAAGVLIALHLKKLAARVPNDSLGAHLINASVLIAIICVALGMLHIAGMVDGQYLMLFFFFVFPMVGVILLVMLWAIWMLVRLAAELRNCAATGENILARQAQRAQDAQAKRA